MDEALQSVRKGDFRAALDSIRIAGAAPHSELDIDLVLKFEERLSWQLAGRVSTDVPDSADLEDAELLEEQRELSQDLHTVMCQQVVQRFLVHQ